MVVLEDGGMAKAYRPVNRDQPFLLAPDMREWLAPDHLVWFLLETVETLDLRAFHARHPNDGAGRAAYDPQMMVALLVYAYCCGERSSRQIERLCQVNVAFRVVCAGDIPDHTKIARFRKVHQDAFEAVFAQVLLIAGKAGLARFETVAIDGTKIAANASLSANRDADWFLREEVAKIIEQARVVDEAEDEVHGREDRGDGTPPDLRDPTRRKARIVAAAAEIEAEQKAGAARQADLDAARSREAAQRLERLGAGQKVIGRYPAGADRAMEAQARLERVIAVQQAKLDRRAARIAAGERPRGKVPVPVEEHVDVKRARAALEAARTHVDTPLVGDLRRQKQTAAHANLTDPQSRIMPTRNGWVQGYNAQLAVTADQIIIALSLGQNPGDTEAFIPMMRAAQDAAATLNALTHNRAHVIGTVLADAGYPSDDNLTAEGPDRLIALGKSRDQARAAKTRPTQGEPPPDATPREAMDHRLRTPEGAALYKRRGATVEPGIGNLKKLLTGFSRRGLNAAKSELHLAAAAFNLRKIHTAALA
jgi:transposase